MSSVFLKDSWICKLVKENIMPTHLNCQLIDIKQENSTTIFVLSDTKHFINAEVTSRSLNSFCEESDIPLLEMKGGHITIDDYSTKLENGRPVIIIYKFTYIGNEVATQGSPQDISVLYDKESFLFENDYFLKINELLSKEEESVKQLFKKMNKNNWFMENVFCENFRFD